ncbi:MAG: hypothetical protein RL113_492 [Pseudomonadota bacterium]|jgi:cytoplasmic iron level regulating protein YaaA (DUF328/UPF0246 family)
MKILLAPSETKKSGGTEPFILENLLFDDLLVHRKSLIAQYQALLNSDNIPLLSKMFGLKKEADIRSYKKEIIHEPAMKAIERYTGVAFDYLEYEKLSKESKTYINTHVILFSNLFGPMRASDLIPEYKLKQGEAIGEIKTEKFYHVHSADLIETYLANDEILDLRAGFYDKFYKPQKSYTTLKFIKEGKVVSHWAKAYRGIVLKEIAKANIKTLEEFIKLPIEGLTIQEIQTIKNKTEITYQIG